MTVTPPAAPLSPEAEALRQQLLAIDNMPDPLPYVSFRKTREYNYHNVVSYEKGLYLGNYLVYLVGRIEALETEVAELRRK